MVAISGCGNGPGKRSKSATDQTVPFCRIELSWRESITTKLHTMAAGSADVVSVRYFKLERLEVVVQMKTEDKLEEKAKVR